MAAKRILTFILGAILLIAGEAEREAELALTSEQETELDRRLAEHVANPGSVIPWDEVRWKLAGGA